MSSTCLLYHFCLQIRKVKCKSYISPKCVSTFRIPGFRKLPIAQPSYDECFLRSHSRLSIRKIASTKMKYLNMLPTHSPPKILCEWRTPSWQCCVQPAFCRCSCQGSYEKVFNDDTLEAAMLNAAQSDRRMIVKYRESACFWSLSRCFDIILRSVCAAPREKHSLDLRPNERCLYGTTLLGSVYVCVSYF